MRNLTAVFVLSLATLTGCNLLKKADADAGSDAAPATADTTVVDAAPTAAALTGKNAASVATFPTQVAMSQPLVIGQTSLPRTSPGAGTVVTTLHPGTVVTRIATNGVNQNLIVFPDPNVPTDTLEGWVTDAAFTAAIVTIHHDAGVDASVAAPAVTTAAPTLSCNSGQVAVLLAGNKLVCHKVCTKDADCPHKACKDFTSVAANTVHACLND